MVKQVTDMGLQVSGEQRDIATSTLQQATNTADLRRLTDTVQSLGQASAASETANQISTRDRLALNERMRSVESQLATSATERTAGLSQILLQIKEIETQFRGINDVANMRSADQDRFNAMVWEKTHAGERYPGTTFFPHQGSPGR